MAFGSSTGDYDYSGPYLDDDERVSSLPTPAEERRLLDDTDDVDEEDDEGRAVVRDHVEKAAVVAPERSYKERRHDRVVREGGMSYRDAMTAVHLEREREELVKENAGITMDDGGRMSVAAGGKEEEDSVAVVSRWDDDDASSKSSIAPRR